MADEITSDNIGLYKKAFSLSVGHTEECVEETVQEMANMINTVCESLNAPSDKVMDGIGLEQFDDALKQILEEKDCDCFKPKSSNK